MNKILKDFTEEDRKEICEQYIQGKSGVALAKENNCITNIIYRILKEGGVKARNDREKSLKFKCNEHYFDVIDTERKAYWLGLLAADGYIKDAGFEGVGIALKEDDKYLLEELKKDIEFTGEVKMYTTKPGSSYTQTTYCRLQISSPYLRSKLISLGVVSHKTTTLVFPNENQVPSKLWRHFIRGYIDGNGSITHSGATIVDKPNIKVCSTYEFLDGMQKALGINHKLNRKKDQEERDINSWNITIGGHKEVIDVLKTLYLNCSIYLKRKHERAIMILEEEKAHEQLCQSA